MLNNHSSYNFTNLCCLVSFLIALNTETFEQLYVGTQLIQNLFLFSVFEQLMAFIICFSFLFKMTKVLQFSQNIYLIYYMMNITNNFL